MLPNHIAIIMDGNGRWATERGHPRFHGHIRGVKRVREITRHARKIGVKALTLYAFSEENWGRPSDEIKVLMRLLEKYLDREGDDLVKNGIKLQTIGNINKFPSKIVEKIDRVKEKSKNNKEMFLTIAISYGSRQEIVNAVCEIAKKIENKNIKIEDINEKLINDSLFGAVEGAPDLIIRTSGEERLSNFLLWQAAYSEFYFTKTLWPDFTEKAFDEAIDAFSKRKRRFGKV